MQTLRLARPLRAAWGLSCRRTTGTIFRREWRTRPLATVAPSGPAVTATNRAEASLTRFWKSVGIEERDGALAVTLDERPLKTPSGNRLLIPQTKRLVATLVAAEWENQDTLLKAHALPMTSLASRAIDAFQDEGTRKETREKLVKYMETDTILFHADEPATLVMLQEKHWRPLLDWARSTFNIDIRTTNSFVMASQTPETLKKVDKILSEFDLWQMAAMERATYSSKSFLIALALVMRRITAEEAARAAHVEVNSQIERWGEVEDSHDVDYHDMRRQLGSAACLISNL